MAYYLEADYSWQFWGSSFTNFNPPTGLQVTNVADRKISVFWNHQSSSKAGFRIRFRGKGAGFSDHTRTKSVHRTEKSATLDGLRSNYEYTISVAAFNAAGESQRSNEVRATTPARTISVSKEGAGKSAVFLVTRTGFTPSSLVIVRATDPQFNQVQFVETAGGDRKIVAKQSIPWQSGLQITFTAFEDADPSATFTNAIVTTCP